MRPPTEAASVGTVGATLIAGVRDRRRPRSQASEIAGVRASIHPRVILFGVIALALLGVLAGLYPVRLQRNDLSTNSYILGAIYIVLSVVGAVAIIYALKALLKRNVMADAVTSTMTMTAMIFATILATGQIYAGVVPFIGLQLIGILIVFMIPEISTWLPGWLF